MQNCRLTDVAGFETEWLNEVFRDRHFRADQKNHQCQSNDRKQNQPDSCRHLQPICNGHTFSEVVAIPKNLPVEESNFQLRNKIILIWKKLFSLSVTDANLIETINYLK